MAKAAVNHLEIEYEIFGADGDEVVLFICGHAGQLTAVPDAVVAELVRLRFQVIRFDNRDVGLSTKFDAAGVPDLALISAEITAGKAAQVPYTLSDMAADAAGLLDALGIASAHVFGGSMGGMIAQHLAAEHPERVASLVSFISSSGNPTLPGATAAAIDAMSAPVPAPGDLEALVEHRVRIFQAIGSPAYPTPAAVLRERARRDLERNYNPAGYVRQSAAILASGDRRPLLRTIRKPAVVLHGEVDPLLPLAGAEDTAKNIAGARLHVVPGMGHDFPDSIAPLVAKTIAGLAALSRRAA